MTCEDLPPSACAVRSELKHADEPLSTPELAERALLSERSARRGVSELQQRGVIETRRDESDPRGRVHTLAGGHNGHQEPG